MSTQLFSEKISDCGICVDFSRQNLSQAEFERLLDYAKKTEVMTGFLTMRNGGVVNISENRAALHTSLRDSHSEAPFYKDVQTVLKRMLDFSEALRLGAWRGSTNERITDVINVGIGGSDMGPRAVWQALQPLNPLIRLHFVSAADGVNLERVLASLNPYTTLVVVSSKSFKTVETLANTYAIDSWLNKAGISGQLRALHMVVVSANMNSVRQLELPQENLFPFWEWVGGRFSVWGSVGLPLVIALGGRVFKEFLDGAEAMDKHTAESPMERNLPFMLALLAYRNITKRQMTSYCMLPYDERLRGIVPWLQQLEMESLGKTPNSDSSLTGSIVWGGHGNESQHSFFQWLRAGTFNTAIDVCWCERASHSQVELHRLLINSAKAQVEALHKRENKNYKNVISTICIDELTPNSLGALMAMYEHKTTILGALFGINPFDQPGVEYGKQLTMQLMQ